MKSLPPYGAPLAIAIAQGKVTSNDIYLFCGWRAWHKSTAFHRSRPVLCLPPWEWPTQYKWPVRYCPVLIFDTGGSEQEYLDQLASTLYYHGASNIRVVSPDFELCCYTK